MLTPTQQIWHNGRFIPWEQAHIHVLSHVVSYGSSVFEGIRCYATPAGPAIFRLHDHVRRMADSAKIYRMDLGLHARTNSPRPCRSWSASTRWNPVTSVPSPYAPTATSASIRCTTPWTSIWPAGCWGKYLGEEALAQGVDVCVSSWKRIAPNTLPALAKAGANYMNSQLIKMEAITNGYSEGIALDEAGYVSEGSGENIFLVRDGRIHTPPLGASVLPGITRDSVLRLAARSGYPTGRNHRPARDAIHCRRGVLHRHRGGDHTHTLGRSHPGRQRQSRPHHREAAKGVLRG